jgi:hypothetical protein
MLLIETASKARLELNRRLANTENLRGSIVRDRADEVDSRTSSARGSLSAESELAIALGTKVVANVIASTSENTITLEGDNSSRRIDVVVQGSRSISALELINRLSSGGSLTSRNEERIAIRVTLNDTLTEPVLRIGNESQSLSDSLLGSVNISNIDPLARNAGIVSIRPTGVDTLIRAVPMVSDEGCPASIDSTTSGLDAKALLVTWEAAEGVLSIGGEVRVLMARVPEVEVVESQGIEGR